LSLDTILAELKSERDRLNQAIAALEGVTRGTVASRAAAPAKRGGRRRGRLSAEARQRMSEAKKAWWAKRKAGSSTKRRG